MLVLTRRVGEELVIGEDIRITCLSIRGNQVRLGIEAPGSVPLYRQEVFLREKAKLEARGHHRPEGTSEGMTPLACSSGR